MSVILTFILQSVRWCLERLYRVSRHEHGLSQEKKSLSENFTEFGVIHLIKTLVTDAISLSPKRNISRLLRKPNTIFNTLWMVSQHDMNILSFSLFSSHLVVNFVVLILKYFLKL